MIFSASSMAVSELSLWCLKLLYTFLWSGFLRYVKLFLPTNLDSVCGYIAIALATFTSNSTYEKPYVVYGNHSELFHIEDLFTMQIMYSFYKMLDKDFF